MLTSRTPRAGSRGIVLVLVLAMLGLLALVGVTFATYAGQSRITNKEFMLSLLPAAGRRADRFRAGAVDHRHQRHPLGDPRAQHGARHVRQRCDRQFVSVVQPDDRAAVFDHGVSQPNGTYYTLTTNIASNDPSFFGYNFTRWVMTVTYRAGRWRRGRGWSTRPSRCWSTADTTRQSNARGRSWSASTTSTAGGAAGTACAGPAGAE